MAKTIIRSISLYVLVLPVYCLITCSQAYAQEGVSIETFKSSSNGNSLFETILATPKQHLGFTLGLLWSHAQEPVFRLVKQQNLDDQTFYPVWFRQQLDISASLGLFGPVEIGIVVPIVIYQVAQDVDDAQKIQASGIGEPRLDLKVRFLNLSHFIMGAGITATFPLGHYISSGRDYMGSSLPTAEPKLLLEIPVKSVRIAGNIGFLVRKKAFIGTQNQTHAFTWNAGISWDVKKFEDPDGLRFLLEAYGEMDIDVSYTSTPVEMLAGFKYRGKSDTIFSIGLGPGISRGLGTPSFRGMVGLAYDPIKRRVAVPVCELGPEDNDGFQDEDGCLDPDNDGDGILDVDDQCPNDPEDFDGFEDEDGCPDTDNDNDGILDVIDQCPMVPENFDGFEDEDGCPEEGPGKSMVKVTDTQLLLSSKIYFDYNKVTIKPISFPILDAVAETIIANTFIQKLRIEGHTDNEGTEAYNRSLSEQRAKTVMEYLVEKGVPKERLESVGYGFSQPKASNDSEPGRAINRRVEFTIVKGDAI